MTVTGVRFEVTSQHPCQIPVIGEFTAGETKVLSPDQIELFEKIYGYKLGVAKFPVHTTCTAILEYEDEDDEKAEEV